MAKKDNINAKNPPVSSLVVLVFSFLFIVLGGFVSSYLQNNFKVSSTEIKPSISSTFDIVKNSWYKDPVLGFGPNKFSESWNLYKPQKVSQTAFWNTNFTESFATIPTLIISTGILGLISWLFFFILFFVLVLEYFIILKKVIL
jgi:O-antigen ligase